MKHRFVNPISIPFAIRRHLLLYCLMYFFSEIMTFSCQMPRSGDVHHLENMKDEVRSLSLFHSEARSAVCPMRSCLVLPRRSEKTALFPLSHHPGALLNNNIKGRKGKKYKRRGRGEALLVHSSLYMPSAYISVTNVVWLPASDQFIVSHCIWGVLHSAGTKWCVPWSCGSIGKWNVGTQP